MTSQIALAHAQTVRSGCVAGVRFAIPEFVGVTVAVYSTAMRDCSDEDLVAKYCDESRPREFRDQAVDELFDRYRGRVAAWCLRCVGDRDWAADLAQEVFLRTLRGLHTFRGGSKFSTWLYSIARNHCFNARESRAFRGEQPLADIDVADQSILPTPDNLVAKEDLRRMRDLVNKTLDETELRVMTLHYGEELSIDSVTRLLGLRNASGAKAYIVSAKRKLQTAVRRFRNG